MDVYHTSQAQGTYRYENPSDSYNLAYLINRQDRLNYNKIRKLKEMEIRSHINTDLSFFSISY